MKKFLLLSILVLFFGCLANRDNYETIRKTPKLKIQAPPGTAWLRDSTFMDMTEVRNLDYLEFLYWEHKHEPEKYDSLLPDTNCFQHLLEMNDPFMNYYLRHPAYRDFPVVGISYEQAIAFCEWRSKMVNVFIYIRDSKQKFKTTESWDTIMHPPEFVHYRLPTREEWEYAAAAGLDPEFYPYGYTQLTDRKKLPVSNTVEYYPLFSNSSGYDRARESDDFRSMDSNTYPGSVYFGQPNSYSIWNLLANVSELTADTLIKGYNYKTTREGVYMGNDSSFVRRREEIDGRAYYRNSFVYKGPQCWLGFRCVCDVLK